MVVEEDAVELIVIFPLASEVTVVPPEPASLILFLAEVQKMNMSLYL